MGRTSDRKEVLAIIPARGNSKGIPKKNIRLLAGKPLIAYTIEAALATPSITRVIVSTDSEEIARIARDYGAEVPFMRPTGIAGDHALTSSVSEHVLSELATCGYVPDYEVMLYPTSPLRSARMLEELVTIGLEQRCHVIAARKISIPRTGLFDLDADDRLRPIEYTLHVPEEQHLASATRRKSSEHTPYYRAYGVFTGKTHVGNSDTKTHVHVLKDPFSFLDIDEQADLELAERILTNGWFSFDWNTEVAQ